MNDNQLLAAGYFSWMQDPLNPCLLVLMRGVPASGKSYRAKEIASQDESIICSADSFFGTTPEEYKANWCVEKLGSAHRECQKKVKILMQRRAPLVVVDNTNTMIREILPYFELAVRYQYRFQLEEPTSPWWTNDISPYLVDKETHREHLEKMCVELWKKNQESHGVPLESIKKMLWRFHTNVTFDQLSSIYVKEYNVNYD